MARCSPPPPDMRTETDPVSETLLPNFLEQWTMDKVQKLNNSECYTPSSEPIRNNDRCHSVDRKQIQILKSMSPL
jgi:hypothetical protein